MAIYAFEDKSPKIGKGTYVSETADVIGEVEVGEGCYIGPGAKIKGDYGRIKIGNKTSVQENCILHARPNDICTVGNYVNVGHGSILHNCTVKDYVVIGMGAIISDYAIVGEWCAIGEGCVVKNSQIIEDGKIAVGIPAKVIGNVSEEYKKEWLNFKNLYVALAKRYAVGLKRVK